MSQIGKKTLLKSMTKDQVDPKLLKSLQGNPDSALISINLNEHSSPGNLKKTESASIDLFDNQPYSQYAGKSIQK